MKFFKIVSISSLLILILILICSHTSISLAQEFKEIDLNTIHKDYNPIKIKKSSQKYYPDEVEKKVNDLLIDGYLFDINRIENHYRFFEKKDAELKKRDKPVTGLKENVLDFINNCIDDRDRYVEAQKNALRGLDDKDLKTLIKIRLRNERLNKAESLLKKEKKDKVGRVFNSLLKSVDIISLSLGSIIGSTIDTAVNTILNIKDLDNISIREKKAIVQYEEFLRSNPESIHAEKVRKKLEKLKEKKRKTEYEKEIELANVNMKQGYIEQANEHYKKALSYYPESKEALKGKETTKSFIEQREKSIEETLKVSKNPPTFSSFQEKEDYEKLLYVTIKGNPEEIISESKEFIEKYKESSLKDEAEYNLSIAYDIQENHEKAKEIMRRLIEKEPDSNMGHHAKLLLNSSDYNKYEAFQKAGREHKIDTFKYALVGEDLAKNNISFGTSRVILEGVKSAETLGMANILGACFRTLNILADDPIPNEEIINRGEEYLQKYPDSEKSKEVHFELAKAYERDHDYANAIRHCILSEKASKKKIDHLKEKMANVLFQKAKLANQWESKTYYYKAILTSYPDTKIAKKAEEQLSALIKLKNQRYRLSKSFLLENKILFGPNSLNIKPELLDGDIRNKEIDDKGISFLKDDKIKIYYQTEEGIEEKVYQLSGEMIRGFEAKLRELNYKKTLYRDKKKIDLKEEGIFTTEKDLDESLNSVYLSKKEIEKRKKNIKFGAEANLSPSAGGFHSQGTIHFSKYSSGLAFGIDERSPNLGLQIPLLSTPLAIESRIGENRFSIYPKIRIDSEYGEDYYLYKD